MSVNEKDTATQLFESLYVKMMDEIASKQGRKKVEYDKVYKRRMLPNFSKYLEDNVFENSIESSLEWIGVEEKLLNQASKKMFIGKQRIIKLDSFYNLRIELKHAFNYNAECVYADYSMRMLSLPDFLFI
jgi:hypothetical protein